MNVKAMYMPMKQGGVSLIRGFVATKGKLEDECVMVSVVDPDLRGDEDGPQIKDVEVQILSTNSPYTNDRFLKCLTAAKKLVEDKEWDAMRKEAAQKFGISGIIPDSKYFVEE